MNGQCEIGLGFGNAGLRPGAGKDWVFGRSHPSSDFTAKLLGDAQPFARDRDFGIGSLRFDESILDELDQVEARDQRFRFGDANVAAGKIDAGAPLPAAFDPLAISAGDLKLVVKVAHRQAKILGRYLDGRLRLQTRRIARRNECIAASRG
ncbi:MAG: hypothetical protein Q8K85_15130, partial [Hyphomicrobium sp.]|nr:hypothetical protein [Hyphomicrobium sp.]